MRHSVVLDPLVDSLIHGLLLVADHPYRDALAAPVGPRPTGSGARSDGHHRGRTAPPADHLDTGHAMPRQRAHPAAGIPTSPGHVTDGLRPGGQTPPCPPGSALGRSHPQHRRRRRAALGIQQPQPLRRRPQNDVRPNTAPNAARCTLITQHGNGPPNANRWPNSAN